VKCRSAPFVCAVILALASLLLVGACGSSGKTATTPPSDAPDAVATEDVGTPDVSTSQPSPGDAQVVVDGAGFSVGDDQEVGFGLVLRNTSDTMDAIDVQVSVNLLSSSGAVVKTEDGSLNVIPAGGTFYYGGESFLDKGDKAKRLEAFVDVGSSEAAQYNLPEVTHVHVVNQDYIGVTVSGQVKNELESSLSCIATIGCVLFDGNGKVVGGGFAYLDADLKPGRTAAFEVLNGTTATPASKVKRAEVSMDNEVVSE